LHYYNFNIGNWAISASHLTLEEEAVYLRLLNFYYQTESPIPKETQLVFRKLRIGSHSDIAQLILDEFFILKADGWHHKDADVAINDYKHKADTARKNGKKGGRPRKEEKTEEAAKPDTEREKTHSVILANQEKSESKANQELITNNQELITNNIFGETKFPIPKKDSPPNKKQVRFLKPTIEEIRQELLTKGCPNLDAEHIWHYYEARDWKLSNGKKISNWRSCIVTWIKNQNKFESKSIDYKTKDDQRRIALREATYDPNF